MGDLRKLARGRDCTVRLSGICRGDRETTVLAHVRMPGISGMGIKAPGVLGAWACAACHDAIDRRAHLDLDRDYVRLAHLDGVMRTLDILWREGRIHAG